MLGLAARARRVQPVPRGGLIEVHQLLILAGFTVGAVIVYVVVIAALSQAPSLLEDDQGSTLRRDREQGRRGPAHR